MSEVSPVVANGNGAAVPSKPKRKAAPRAAKTKAKAVQARKARQVDLSKLDRFGFRKGSVKSQAAAIYARPNGATLRSVRDKVGSNQFNLITELEKRGFKFKRDMVSGAGHRQATRYHLIAK